MIYTMVASKVVTVTKVEAAFGDEEPIWVLLSNPKTVSITKERLPEDHYQKAVFFVWPSNHLQRFAVGTSLSFACFLPVLCLHTSHFLNRVMEDLGLQQEVLLFVCEEPPTELEEGVDYF